MSKYKKNEILNIMKSIHNEHKIIQVQLANHNVEEVKKILAVCQEKAMQIGNEIEILEGVGTDTVALLEEYCEFLYQITISLDLQNNREKTCELLHNLLDKIEDSFRNEFDMNKLEIAFFPYKAAMWDSLESIWLAARDDPECECFVVPIPYFDKNPDGTFRQMNYDGDDFPSYVPITKWEDYKPQERKPDVAYIHNPYDNGNRVTSIHPDYYAKELKKCTGMLVYVPYFVVNSDVPEHFCICAGTIHADRVIVQSEEVKDQYITIFEKWIKENNFQKLFPNLKDKFLALGSPKFDKVWNTKAENTRIPEEWEKLISKEDGSRKRVVLYNTSLSSLLNYKEQMLIKIESVLQVFQRHDGIVLLWRPHPLMESTIASLCPDVLGNYKQLVQNYRQSGWGIYDNSPDIHRAIAISDAYYGDESSVVAMYKITGKPVMIQNPETITK